MGSRPQYPRLVGALRLALLALTVSAMPAAAQTYVFNAAKFVTGHNPESVTTADFNKDGHVDLAIANFNDNTVSVLLGASGGALQAKVKYTVGTSPIAFAGGDFNKDGTLDLHSL